MRMRVAREEIFGPVVCVLPWHDRTRLLEDVNGLPYGLTASVWTDEISIALPIVDAPDAGYVWVNDAGAHYWGTPFGGFGDSGIGREECLSELHPAQGCASRGGHAAVGQARRDRTSDERTLLTSFAAGNWSDPAGEASRHPSRVGNSSSPTRARGVGARG